MRGHFTPHSEETKNKISKTKKEQHINTGSGFKPGCVPWNKGKKCPWISERNIEYNKTHKRELHPHWKGGVSNIEKIIRRMPEYLVWRSNVFIRDNFICVECGDAGYVTAHHIKAFTKIIQENNIKSTNEARLCIELWNLENGITLCEKCHSKTDNYRGRARNK